MHVKDLQELQERAPEVHAQYSSGNFAILNSCNSFYAIAVDQAHEQNSAVVKGTGGARDLLHDAAMLRRWMLCGPQLRSVPEDFGAESSTISKKLFFMDNIPHSKQNIVLKSELSKRVFFTLAIHFRKIQLIYWLGTPKLCWIKLE